jgi:enoyl-CoA hydratase
MPASQAASGGESADRVLYEARGCARILTLNRPDKLNPLDWKSVRALRDAFTRADTDPQCRVVIVTGAGKSFSAGGDLDGYIDLYRLPAEFQAFLEDFFALLQAMERSTRVVIAAVNGHCVAGGLEVALACDLVVVAREARIADGHLNFGQLPGAGGSQRLPRAIGALRAKHLILTGQGIDGVEAERIGLASLAVPRAELMDTVLKLAEELAKKSALGLAMAKRLVDDGASLSLNEALRMEIERVHRYATQSHDAMEGLLAFRDKRDPAFKGR